MKQKISNAHSNEQFKSDVKKWRKNESRVHDILSESQEEQREKQNELDGFPTDAKVESEHKNNSKEK